MVEFWAEWVRQYPIVSLEDGMAEDDWDGWKMLTDALGKKIQLVGDDIFVTNTERLAMGIEKGIANSILIKVNQIGTLTETLEAMKMASDAGYTSWSRTVPARPRMPSSPTWPWPPARARSRPGRQPHRPHREIQSASAHREDLGAGARFGGRKALRQ
jgi:hypothetical protein